MSIFKKSRKKFTVSERDPNYKVRYLGNVQTSMMRGDGCVDKPTAILWNNFSKSPNAGLDMKLSISASGLKAVTKEQGLTEYRAHRISYCIAHPKYPKLFVWVYRHEAKKLKVELRCHAVQCKTEAKAKAMAVQLHDKLASALSEFMREKCRKQSTRLALQRTNSLPVSGSTSSSATSHLSTNGLNVRNKFLSTAQNFKPPVDRSASAPKLGAITEDFEPEELMGELEEEEEDDEDLGDDFMLVMHRKKSSTSDEINAELAVPVTIEDEPGKLGTDSTLNNQTRTSSTSFATTSGNSASNASASVAMEALTESMFALEVGNDVEALKKDSSVRYQLDHSDSEENDDDSSESGFSEQDLRGESSSNGSNFGSDPQLSSNGSNSPSSTSNSVLAVNGGSGTNQSNNNSAASGNNTNDSSSLRLPLHQSANSDSNNSSVCMNTSRPVMKPGGVNGEVQAATMAPAVTDVNKWPSADPTHITGITTATQHVSTTSAKSIPTATAGYVPNGPRAAAAAAAAGEYKPVIVNERRL